MNANTSAATEEPDSLQIARFSELIGETITNTPIVNWHKIKVICTFLEKRQNWQSFLNFILTELERRLKDYSEGYVIMHILIILEVLTRKYQYKRMYQDLTIRDIIDQLITRNIIFVTSVNIRLKIILFVRKWPYGRQMCYKRYANVNDRFGVVTVFDDKGICKSCARDSKIICAACVEIFCGLCSLKTLFLPTFGYQGEVRICDNCYSTKSQSSSSLNEGAFMIKKQSTSNEVAVKNAFMKAIECPICLEIMQKPIIQCKLGHSMCQACTNERITACPICRDEITSSRNFLVEQLLEIQEISCVFANEGCTELFKSHERKLHETKCDFRQVECEGKNFCKWECDWKGSFNEIEIHFAEFHRNILMITHDMAVLPMGIYLNKKLYNIQLVNFRYGKAYFWCKFKMDTASKNAVWTVQMIGSKEEAAKYGYKFTLINGSIRKFEVTETCNDDSVDTEEIFNSKKCIVVPFDIMNLYMKEKNGVESTLTIFNIPS